MSEFSLGFIFEAIVAVLLVMTISYCFIVNRKLENLRSDKSDLRAIIRDLYTATGHAEQAFGALRHTTDTIEEALGEKIAEARNAEKTLASDLQKGEALMSKLAVIARSDKERTASKDAAGKAAMHRAAAPRARAQSVRHSEVGLGLLNKNNQRRAAATDAARKEVA